MSNYILHLYKQYCDSLGIECNNINLFCDNDFIEWIEELKQNTRLYKNYIEYLGVNLGKYSSIELDKGKYDSIGKEFTSIVSFYADTMNIANTRLVVHDDSPIIIYDSKIYGIGDCNSIITHNPFMKRDITNLILMHNMGFNICLGIYGNESDKDKLKKLEILKKISETMTDDLEFYYDTEDRKYLACIKSERKIKSRVLKK
jgi:hypothetical protein